MVKHCHPHILIVLWIPPRKSARFRPVPLGNLCWRLIRLRPWWFDVVVDGRLSAIKDSGMGMAPGADNARLERYWYAPAWFFFEGYNYFCCARGFASSQLSMICFCPSPSRCFITAKHASPQTDCVAVRGVKDFLHIRQIIVNQLHHLAQLR